MSRLISMPIQIPLVSQTQTGSTVAQSNRDDRQIQTPHPVDGKGIVTRTHARFQKVCQAHNSEHIAPKIGI
jgi:hypothetical protein